MTSSELYSFIYAQAPGCTTVRMDGDYAHPSRRWILDVFAPALKEDMDLTGVGVYLKNAFDCDKFAAFAYTMAKVCHARTSPDCAKGLAFGMWCYTTRQGGGHAINFAVVYDGGKPELMFFEPQTGKEVQLIQEEKTGATYII